MKGDAYYSLGIDCEQPMSGIFSRQSIWALSIRPIEHPLIPLSMMSQSQFSFDKKTTLELVSDLSYRLGIQTN